MKMLLVRNDNIGDLICATPAIEALKKNIHHIVSILWLILIIIVLLNKINDNKNILLYKT